MDSFERDECGAFVYPNWFKMPPQDTAIVHDVCVGWHAGAWCPMYRFVSSGDASPGTIVELLKVAEKRLAELVEDYDCWDPLHHAYEDAVELEGAIKTLTKWADGVRELVDTPSQEEE